ncbi:MAG: hypothetical protein J0I12_13010 [Candidatus Eremiobacteraeota bacterium]|nr:hypothetical protein [Candidatus Eremiobacteraeota bacterium]
MYAQYNLGNPSFCAPTPFSPGFNQGYGNFGMTQQMLGSPYGMPQGWGGMQNQMQQMMMMMQTMMMFQQMQMQMQGGGMGPGNFYPPMPQPYGPIPPNHGFPPFPPQPYNNQPYNNQPYNNQPYNNNPYGNGPQPFPGPRPQPFPAPAPPPWNGPKPTPQPAPAPKPVPKPAPKPLNAQQWRTSLNGNPGALKAYNAMTPEQRATVDRLGMNHPAEAGGADANFLKIMGNGRLTNRDRQGQTTLQHLDQLDRQKVPKEVDKPTAYRELVANIAEPGNTNQRGRGTCAPTSVEYVHVKNQPSDYARVVTGLLSEKGEVRMNNGETMKRNASGLGPDNSGRTSVDRIYQSSMMDYADGDKMTYNNQTDQHVGADGKNSHQGMYLNEEAKALNAVTGERQTSRGVDPNNTGFMGIRRFTTDRDLRHELSEGRNPIVCMTWDQSPGARDKDHALTITKMDGDYVYLRNPWGNDEKGGTNGPPREVVDPNTGLVRMKKDDFYARLTGINQREDDRSFAGRWWDRITGS